MVMSMENGPTLKEMDLARSDLPECPKVYEWTKNDENFYKTEEEKKLKKLGGKSSVKMMFKDTITSKLPKKR